MNAGQWQLLNSLPDALRSPADLKMALSAAALFDQWHEQNTARPVIKFPYLVATAQVAHFLTWDVLVWQDLYRQQRAVATLEYVLDRFTSLAENYGFHPVYVVIPMPEDLIKRQRGHRSHYAGFVAQMRERFGTRLTVVDVMETLLPQDDARFHTSAFSGHASPFGNAVVAEALYRQWPRHDPSVAQRSAGPRTP